MSTTTSEFFKIANFLQSTLDSAGISGAPRRLNPDLWLQTSGRLAYQPVDYSSAMVEYQLAYFSGVGYPSTDLSLVLEHDRRPCGVWPLSVSCQPDGKYRIGSNGGPVLPPLFLPEVARKSMKSITGGCLSALRTLCHQLGQSGFESVEGYMDNLGLSEWHNRLMMEAGRVSLEHDLYLNLAPTLVEVKSGFRKSYKALITSGSKLWDVQVVTAPDVGQWEEFRLLHRDVAGRATRSEESWRLQHSAVASGDAFFVRLRDKTDRMVGAGLFHVTRDEGLYAVGAYDRKLFDQPLGHVVQFHAIEEMKRRGVRWYRLGARVYPGNAPSPTQKELSISDFKQGFASHLFPRYKVTCIYD